MSRPSGALGGDQPDFAVLADWLEDRLTPVQAARIAAAVEDGDDELRDSVEWLRGFVEASQSDSRPPPPLVRQRLRQHYADWLEGRVGRDRSTVPTPAALMFDSRVDQPLSAVRGGSDSSAVHLAYRSEVADLVLDVRMLDAEHARVQGQVLPLEETSSPIFEVVAESPAVSIRVVDGDELGRFLIAPMPLDRYDLTVSNGEITLAAALDLRYR